MSIEKLFCPKCLEKNEQVELQRNIYYKGTRLDRGVQNTSMVYYKCPKCRAYYNESLRKITDPHLIDELKNFEKGK